jgi:N-acetylmuramoyl-L-alanine amidase
MAYKSIVISSGHGLYVRGASGVLDEVDEARKVVDGVAFDLQGRGVEVMTYHDNVSKTQDENLNRIVDFHNSRGAHDLDVSVHFNAYQNTDKPMGTEVLYVTQQSLAAALSVSIADCGFINRGAKKRTDLFFLNNTEAPAVLLEVCFVDSTADAEVYGLQFDEICEAVAEVLAGQEAEASKPSKPPETTEKVYGTCSHFGGPDDMGVEPDEGLAFISEVEEAPQLFLPYQPSGTTGLARRLNIYVHYLAMRFDYDKHPKETLLDKVALVRAVKTGISLKAFPADWGPAEWTGRIADLSPGLIDDLGITTDDEVEVIFPYQE